MDVVFEMSGGEVFDASYRALAPFGRIVAYGIATNTPTRSARARCCATRARSWASTCSTACGARRCSPRRSEDLFDRAVRGELKVILGATYPLEQAAQAQIDLHERRTTGKLLLDPARP